MAKDLSQMQDTQNNEEGGAERFDDRLTDVIHLLDEAPLGEIRTVLDVGAGKGEVAKRLARQGKSVTCTGVQINSYVSDIEALREGYGIDYVECDIEHMQFPDESFDAVIMCHVLEHCPNVSIALGQARRVLKKGGWLLVFVPPQEDVVCAGHVSVGWNVGQLMYVLLLNGFDAQSGKFIEYGYNVCGFVRRSERALPELRCDRGDISVLAGEGLFPLPIGTGDGVGDNFYGSIKAVNWPNISRYRTGTKNSRVKQCALTIIDRALPMGIKYRAGRFLVKLGRLLLKVSVANPDRLS